MGILISAIFTFLECFLCDTAMLTPILNTTVERTNPTRAVELELAQLDLMLKIQEYRTVLKDFEYFYRQAGRQSLDKNTRLLS